MPTILTLQIQFSNWKGVMAPARVGASPFELEGFGQPHVGLLQGVSDRQRPLC